ncbi:GNAT family N-acetyltransferase [Candidatus Woesearchaeota archaeon]|nr:GNAT family N-acetyltransferase [Candidatus Woesearchaeota archaeon]
MNIRLAKQKDIPVLVRIVRNNYSQDYAFRSRKELLAMFYNKAFQPQYIVAEKDKNIVGFGGYVQSPMDYSIYEIFWVNIKQGFQRQGIGTVIVRHLLRKIQKMKGKDKARMVVLTTRSPAFYKKFGFKTACRLKSREGNSYFMSLPIR